VPWHIGGEAHTTLLVRVHVNRCWCRRWSGKLRREAALARSPDVLDERLWVATKLELYFITVQIEPEVALVPSELATIANSTAVVSIVYSARWLVLTPLVVHEGLAARPLEGPLGPEVRETNPRALPIVPPGEGRRDRLVLAPASSTQTCASNRRRGEQITYGASEKQPSFANASFASASSTVARFEPCDSHVR
jgi:hypothetical protein